MMLSAKIGAWEFDDREVRLAIVKTGGRLPVLLERHAEPVEYAEASERDDAYVRAVENLVGRIGVKPAAHVLCASTRHAVVRAITVPFKGSRRVSAAVRFELEPYLAFPIEDLIVDYSTIREAEGGTHLLAVGVRRNVLEDRLATLGAAGIDPEGIGLDATGLLALSQVGRKTPPGLHASLHVREKGSILAVLCGKSLAYVRHLPITVAQMHENPAAAARDVHNSLRAFQVAWEGEEQLTALTVTGVTLFEEERQLFEEHFDVPVTYLDLAAMVKAGPRSKGDAEAPAEAVEGNRWEALVGVALAAAGNVAYSYNFRQGELAQPQALVGVLRHAAFSLVIGSIALLGAVAFMFLDYRSSRAEVERLGGEMWQIFVETFPNSQEAQGPRPPSDPGGQTSFTLMQQAVEGAQGQRRGISLDLFSQPTPLEVLAEISRTMPSGDDVQVTRVQMVPSADMKQTRVVIEGLATSPEVFSQAFAKLSGSKILAVNPNPTQESAAKGLEFTINAILQGKDSAQS